MCKEKKNLNALKPWFAECCFHQAVNPTTSAINETRERGPDWKERESCGHKSVLLSLSMLVVRKMLKKTPTANFTL